VYRRFVSWVGIEASWEPRLFRWKSDGTQVEVLVQETFYARDWWMEEAFYRDGKREAGTFDGVDLVGGEFEAAFASVGDGLGGYLAFDVVVAWVVEVFAESYRLAFVVNDVDALPVGLDVAVAVAVAVVAAAAAAAVVAASVFDEVSGWGVSGAVDVVVEEYVEAAVLEAVSVVEVGRVAWAVYLDCPRSVVVALPVLSATPLQTEAGIVYTVRRVDSIRRHHH